METTAVPVASSGRGLRIFLSQKVSVWPVSGGGERREHTLNDAQRVDVNAVLVLVLSVRGFALNVNQSSVITASVIIPQLPSPARLPPPLPIPSPGAGRHIPFVQSREEIPARPLLQEGRDIEEAGLLVIPIPARVRGDGVSQDVLTRAGRR